MTTEEKARAYADNLPVAAATWGMRKSVIADAFKAGASHVLSLPLSQRLTDEERERVKGLHYHLTSVLAYCHPSADNIVEATIHDIESIFGKELFGEDKKELK